MHSTPFILALIATATIGYGADTVSNELSPTDRFTKSIRWVNSFDPAPGTAEPVYCLMRIQHRMTGDPLDWAPAVMVYRMSPHEPLLLRICQPEGSSLEQRTEYNYTAEHPLSGNRHRFTLEITGSLVKEEGKLRLLVNNKPVSWKRLTVVSHPSKQVVSERHDIGTVITGDAPTLFPGAGRWIANGDPSQGSFTYELLEISSP